MQHYTDIIVGAGSSGSVIAAKLSADQNRSVLLIEAGPDYPDRAALPREIADGYQPALRGDMWGWEIRGPLDRRIRAPRGKLVGGCSAINSCIALRPDPADFDTWPGERGEGSAWSWPQVLASFVRIEHDLDFVAPYHGQDGPIPVRRWSDDELLPVTVDMIDAMEMAGHPIVPDLNQPGSSGAGIIPMNLSGRSRVSAADAFLAPARARQNLVVQANTLVSRVLFTGRAATGVEALTPAGARVFRAGHIVLCAGAFGTPAILLRSGIGPATQLRALGITPIVDLAGVGANLADHSQCYLAIVPRMAVTASQAPCAQTLVRYTSESSPAANDMQLCVLNHVELALYAPELAGRAATDPVMICPILQLPASRGRVALADADPLRGPVIIIDYTAAPDDLRRHREGLRMAWDIAHSKPLRRLLDGVMNLDAQTIGSDRELDRFIRARVQTAHHPVGTAKMGSASDPMSVVDHACRVHGIEGLRVADASIMPAIIRANTNLACVMIGDRAGQIMLADPES